MKNLLKIIKKYLKNTIFCFLIIFFPINNKKTFFLNDVGVCTLVCHRDVIMLIYSLKSFFYHLGFELPVYIVNDGSLTELDKRVLKRFFNASIANSSDTEKDLRKRLKRYPYLAQHRFADNNGNYKYKLDVLLTCPFKRYVFMDADLLFLQKPTEIFNWIVQGKKQNYYSSHEGKFFEKDYFPEYSLRKLLYKYLKIKMNAGFSSGLFLIYDGKNIDLKFLNSLFKLYKEIYAINNPALEENALSVLCSQKHFQCLPVKRYVVMSLYSEYQQAIENISDVVLLHFGWDTKHRYISHALKAVLKNNFFKVFSPLKYAHEK